MQPKQLLIYQMLEKKRIRIINPEQLQICQQQQIDSLKLLQQRQSSYLNYYDQLFRYVNLWLLQKGYTLTNHEPHQVLKSICLLHCPEIDIQTLVQHRHHLKKGLLKNSDSKHWEKLVFCLDKLKSCI